MFVIIGVLLAATAAQAEDRKCIREMYELTGDMTQPSAYAIRKTSSPIRMNTAGFVIDECKLRARKGAGAKQQRDVLCD